MKTSLSTPRFLRASTPRGLERAMLNNNIKRKSWHNYQIVFDGKNWFAWYHADLSEPTGQELEQVLGQKEA